jgi:hypothetical protein
VFDKFLYEDPQEGSENESSRVEAPDSVENPATLFKLSQYIDFDEDCSGLFSDREIEVAKRSIEER